MIETDDAEPLGHQTIDEPRIPTKAGRIGTRHQHHRVAALAADVDPQVDRSHPEQFTPVDVTRHVGHRNER